MNLQQWLSDLTGQLGLADLDTGEETVRLLLDVARDSAHEVTRIAAPLTTYVVGVAVARGMPLEQASATVTRLLGAGEGPTAD